MKELTLKQLVEFCLEHKKEKVFQHYTESDIAWTILKAAEEGCFLYYVNETGTLTGIVCGRIENGAMHVTNILTTERQAIKAFVKQFKAKWPTLNLTAIRKGFPVSYNTSKLCNKLL